MVFISFDMEVGNRGSRNGDATTQSLPPVRSFIAILDSHSFRPINVVQKFLNTKITRISLFMQKCICPQMFEDDEMNDDVDGDSNAANEEGKGGEGEKEGNIRIMRTANSKIWMRL